MNPSIFPCWAIVSQMGHRTTAGHVTIDTTLGVPLLVVEVPGAEAGEPETDGWGETYTRSAIEPRREIVSPASLYSVSVTTETAVRAMVARSRPRTLVQKPLLIAEEVETEADEEPTPEGGWCPHFNGLAARHCGVCTPGLDKEPAPTGEPKPAEVLDRATGPGTDGASDGERVVGCPDGVLCRLNGCTPDHCNVVPF